MRGGQKIGGGRRGFLVIVKSMINEVLSFVSSTREGGVLSPFQILIKSERLSARILSYHFLSCSNLFPISYFLGFFSLLVQVLKSYIPKKNMQILAQAFYSSGPSIKYG